MSADDFLRIFRRRQRALEEDLRAVGDTVDHGATIGHEREEVLHQALGDHLPQRVTIRRGQILAPSGERSSEWDAILCDPDDVDRLVGVRGAVPVESVLAVVSAKSQLDSAAIDGCAEAAARLRAMTLQDGGAGPMPAVFAFGLDGIRPKTLEAALKKAAAEHGAVGAIDGVLVLSDYTTLPDAGGVHRILQDEDAYCRFVLALEDAVLNAPRRQFRLAPYINGVAPPPEPPHAEGKGEDGGAPTSPTTPKPPPRPPGGDGIALRDRSDEPDPAATRTANRLLAGVAAADPAAAERLRATLTADEPAAALTELAADADGALLDAAARLLTLFGRWSAAAEAFERLAGELGADRPRALIYAAQSHDAAGDADTAAKLRAEAHDLGPGDPAVLLAGIAELNDLEQRLAQLDRLELTTARDRARAATIRGETLSQLDRDAEGIDEARAALAGYWAIDLAERLAILLARTFAGGVPGADSPEPETREALQVLDDLVDELLGFGLTATAMHLESRVVQVLRRVGRNDLIAAICVFWVPRADRGDADARTTFALAVLDAIEPRAAAQIAPAELPETVEGRLLGARLTLAGTDREPPDPDQVAAAITTLDTLLDEELPEHEEVAVAEARALAAADGLAVWSDAAAEIIEQRSPFYTTLLRSRHLSAHGRDDEAQALLLSYADGPEGIRGLIDLEAQAGRWDHVVRLVEDGLGDQAPPVERLRRADAFTRLGRDDDAREAYHALALAPDASPYLAERAWFQLTQALSEGRQWRTLATVAQEWYDHRPASPMALWVTADALARTGAMADAWALTQRDGRSPDSAAQRRLIAELAGRVLPLSDALERIAELSDAVDRADEHLEAMLITLSAGQDKEELPAALEERVKQTFTDFPERFPDSRIVRSVKAPSTAEEWKAFAERHLAERRRLSEEIDVAVATGKSPLAAFGALGGTALSIWFDALALPLVAPVAELQETDLADARAAIAGAAVWDASALASLSLLRDDVAATLTRALPASTAARAVHVDVEGLERLLDNRDPERSAGSLTIESGRPVIVQRRPEELHALRSRAERVRGLAARVAIADPDLAGRGPIAAALRDGDMHEAGASWASGLVLAEQRGVPLFCDDRVIRGVARAHGVPAFGTVALLRAATDRGLLDADARADALWALRAAGGHALPAETTEILGRIEGDDYTVTPAVNSLLRDRDAWGNNPAAEFLRWAGVLRAIWKERPEGLTAWTAHVIAEASVTLDNARETTATGLVLPLLGPAERDVGFVRALVAAMHEVNLRYFAIGDPLAAAFEQLGRYQHPGEEPVIAVTSYVHALSRVPITDALRFI